MSDQTPPPPPDTDSYYEAYQRFARTFRTWAIAFPVAVIAFLIGNEHVHSQYRHRDGYGIVIGLLITVVVLQVTIVFAYKVAMSYYYTHEAKPDKANCTKIVDCVTNSFWLEAIVDGISLLLIALAMGTLFLGVLF